MTPSPLPLFLLVLAVPCFAVGHPGERRRTARSRPELARRASRSVPPAGYADPRNNNGSWLTSVPDTFPAGLGEPINVVLSANSDPAVLVDQMNDGGLRNYYASIGFSGECLGQHEGSDQEADLGDGHGYLNETAVIRWDYGDPTLGTCKETIEGGNHFRYWIQNGDEANTGAIFMALSYELPLSDEHDIIDNGYNLARDWLVGNATSNQTIPTSNLTNSSIYSGQSSFGNYTYQTSVLYVSGILPNTSDGINHFLTVGDGQNAVDGLVAIMTVSIVTKPVSAAASSALSFRLPPRLSAILLPFLLYCLFATWTL